MKTLEILNKISQIKKGAYTRIVKAHNMDMGIVKYTTMVVRLGVDYANMAVNKDKQVGKLPWGNWVAGLEGYVIEHKGNYYLRVANSYTEHISTTYMRNGKVITKAEVVALIGGEKPNSVSSVYNIKFENIVDIG